MPGKKLYISEEDREWAKRKAKMDYWERCVCGHDDIVDALNDDH